MPGLCEQELSCTRLVPQSGLGVPLSVSQTEAPRFKEAEKLAKGPDSKGTSSGQFRRTDTSNAEPLFLPLQPRIVRKV